MLVTMAKYISGIKLFIHASLIASKKHNGNSSPSSMRALAQEAVLPSERMWDIGEYSILAALRPYAAMTLTFSIIIYGAMGRKYAAQVLALVISLLYNPVLLNQLKCYTVLQQLLIILPFHGDLRC